MPTTLPPLQQDPVESFAGISRFLRQDMAHEESRQLRDSLAALSQDIEGTVRARRLRGDPGKILRCVEQLAHGACEHQRFLAGLGCTWHAMHELRAYLRAVRALRQALAAWQGALERRSSSEAARFDAFERIAWCTLGEALLVIDLYEQEAARQAASVPEARAQGRPERLALLARLRDWWHAR